ncbi:hypothetical protein [Acidihalobacter yilgarnensis]|uniref:hypothetical protein n=1 Tax=Acidihalobacter yilgarnensis TaxID=2819280 RepID=UPI0012EA1BF7|nr:hypothetical protein [Acidihalobacter yilgarnensis]
MREDAQSPEEVPIYRADSGEPNQGSSNGFTGNVRIEKVFAAPARAFNGER